jgi:Uma2 family endonuclease
MRTLVLDPPTAGLGELFEARRRSGLDRFDEVWEGVYHMVPGPPGAHSLVEWQLARLLSPLAAQAGLHAGGQFNLGEGESDFRVPDGGIHRTPPSGAWQSTAALILEIVSPNDESWEKLPFYADRHVDEVLIVDPQEHSVSWLALKDGEYQRVEQSGLIDMGAQALAEQLDWPLVTEG